jgi:hypothetical protein
MVISAIGRMAAKAAIKKISNASAKKAQAFMRADKKKTDIMKQGLPMSAITMAEGSGRTSGAFKNMGRILSVLPAAAGAPGKLRASVNSAVSKKLSSLSKKQLMSLSQNISAGPLLSSKVKGQIKNALDLLKKPSRQKGGGMATRGMGAALKKGGMSKGKKYI